MRDAYDVIRAPVITEKMGLLAEKANVVAFKVAPDANKIEIRQAVEALFEVKVMGVNTLSVAGKARRRGYIAGRAPSWKKAMVTLAEGQTIDVL